MTAGPKNALASWSQSALRPVELPTGMKALVRLPDVVELLRNDRLPQELRELAFRYAKGGIEVTTLKPEEVVQFVQFTYELTARMVRYLAPADSPAWDEFRSSGESPEKEGWQPVSLTGGMLRELDVDQADLDALAKISGRQTTPNEVTALSRFDRGLLSASELQERIDADPDGRVGDFAPFRGEPGVPDDGADGEDVRGEAVGATRGGRPGRRAGARRGDRA